MFRRSIFPLLLGGTLLVAGCVTRPVNAPLASRAANTGYYFHRQARPNNSDETLFLVAFSGGGTRAAALAYGVLEELRATTFATPTGERRLLDEIDAISSVSGGSVTAAAYGLYGDGIFPRLETDFLKRNVQGNLLLRTANPLNWPRLASGRFGRSELAAEFYDRILFNGATIGDLGRRPGPFVILNSTDISTGARFEFTQYQFDLLCSDVDSFPISRAVAASSAVPAALTPITLNNYAGDCGFVPLPWITRRYRPDEGRVRLRARELRSYTNTADRPFIHVVDGGVSDNLGLRAFLDGMHALQAQPELVGEMKPANVKRVVVISANAYSFPDRTWDRREQPPGSFTVGTAAANHTLDRYSFETLELVREQFDAWQGELNGRTEIKLYPVMINFTNFRDLKERRFFLNLPTSFVLPPTDVDKLVDAGHRLLRQNRAYRGLLADLKIPLPPEVVEPSRGDME
jgi:NTE family protein